MKTYARTLSGIAMLSVFSLLATAQDKKPKDQGEYDIYNQVLKDAADPAKQLQALDKWTEKYPQTDFSLERQWFYVSAYNGTRQPEKVLSTAAGLLDRDFPDPKQKLTVLYLAALNIQALPNASDEQIAIGEKAAKQLLAFTPAFFTPEHKPAGTTDADWAKARGDLDRAANDSLEYAAMLPGNRALAKGATDPANCAAAEAAYTKAVESRPNSAKVAYALAGALRCQQAATPEKVKLALFYYARAAVLDPAQGGIADPKLRQSIETYLRKAYEKFHGSEEGLEQLKQLAAGSSTAPAGFQLKNSGEMEAEKDATFAQNHPQLALWLGIRKQLTAAGGEEFFNSQLKDAAVPKLKGTLVGAKPACKPRELLVAISDSTQPEVTIKLSAAPNGKVETGTEIQWEGTPAAFQKEPFSFTMTAESASVENLKVSPCAVVARQAKKK